MIRFSVSLSALCLLTSPGKPLDVSHPRGLSLWNQIVTELLCLSYNENQQFWLRVQKA
ncbi:hypothetical protein [Anabaena sp. CS-542/02]|uniref:hypothetical protein n=1 Tax=Anabaena sp. CS-542/02 TaxID=3021719 RepID=UPI002330FD26|nr:hypothetical protein [Anabaena sp. CS-542/02]MDB9445805.1 hypothetical protein [Anabaena sp. CS-542/02]